MLCVWLTFDVLLGIESNANCTRKWCRNCHYSSDLWLLCRHLSRIPDSIPNSIVFLSFEENYFGRFLGPQQVIYEFFITITITSIFRGSLCHGPYFKKISLYPTSSLEVRNTQVVMTLVNIVVSCEGEKERNIKILERIRRNHISNASFLKNISTFLASPNVDRYLLHLFN